MFVAPGTAPDFGHKLTREAAERATDNWWRLRPGADRRQSVTYPRRRHVHPVGSFGTRPPPWALVLRPATSEAISR